MVGGVAVASMVKSLRADTAEFARWDEAAAARGVSFNRWARAALNDQRELDVSLAQMEEREERRDGSE